MKNYYNILEIDPTSTQEQIRAQHRLLVHAWHPDKFPNPELRAKAEERLKEINEAYSILSNDKKRQDYDRIIQSQETRSPPVSTPKSQTTTIHQPADLKVYCDSCRLPNETKYVEFYENIGMVFMRSTRSVKGNLCKPCITYFFWTLTGRTMLLGWWGVISLIVTPFILLNNSLRYISSTNLEMPLKQVVPKPSIFWVFSTISGYLILGYILMSIFTTVSAKPAIISTASVYSIRTPTLRATKAPLPTSRSTLPAQSLLKPIISYNGKDCVPWSSINSSDLESWLCIYGKVYTYGPYSDKWHTIQFSPNSTAFRVTDFNYYYASPLTIGDCVIVYGRIRDNGAYLIITPDKDADNSIRVGPSSICVIP